MQCRAHRPAMGDDQRGFGGQVIDRRADPGSRTHSERIDTFRPLLHRTVAEATLHVVGFHADAAVQITGVEEREADPGLPGGLAERFARDGWLPIDLRIGDTFPLVVAAYREYDVLLVNSIADGMNLISKEAPLLNERDGVVVLPKEMAADAVAETERVVSTESDMRKSILAGMDPEKAYLKYGKF